MSRRANLRKRLAQKAWEQEKTQTPARKQRNLERDTVSFDASMHSALVRRRRTYNNEDIQRMMQEEDRVEDRVQEHEEYAFGDDEDDDQPHAGYYGDEEEEELHLDPRIDRRCRWTDEPSLPRAYSLVPKSEHEIYTTDYGDRFRVSCNTESSSLSKRSDRFRPPKIGLDRDQHTLRFQPPEHPGPGTIALFGPPITEDGYLDPADRDNPLKPPYDVDYVQEVLQRNDVIRTHPDYEFLSNFASHLSLLPEDVFLEESVTRKQAAASALLEAVTARRQARALQLQELGRRIDRLRTEKANAAHQLEIKTRSLTATDRREGQNFLANFQGIFATITAAEQVDQFLSALKEMMTAPGHPANVTDNAAHLSAAVDYLTNLSPNFASDMTERVLKHYQKNKTHADMQSAVKLAMFVYAVIDFLASITSTFAKSFLPGAEEGGAFGGSELDSSFDFEPIPENLRIPRIGGQGWIPIDVTLAPHPSIETNEDEMRPFGKVPKRTSTKQLFDAKLLLYVFEPQGYNLLPLLFFVRTGMYIREPDTFDTATEKQEYGRELRRHFQWLGDAFADNEAFGPDPDEAKSVSMSDLIDTLVSGAGTAAAGADGDLHGIGERILRYLRRGTVRSSLRAFALDDEVSNIARAVALSGTLGDPEEIGRLLGTWLTKLNEEEQRLVRDIDDIDFAIEDIRRRIDTLVRTGRAPGEPEINVPFRTSLEWALKPINTGRMEVAPWALSAINSGHGTFKLFFARPRPRWLDIERNVLQRDELMGPLFAELCATFVSKAKIANPRRYLHVSANQERVKRKASLLKSMLMGLRYDLFSEEFTARRYR